MEANHSALLRAACPHNGDQAEAARRCGISPAFFNQMINGRRSVPVPKAAAIERVLGVSRRDLFPDRWQEIWPELATEAAAAINEARRSAESTDASE